MYNQKEDFTLLDPERGGGTFLFFLVFFFSKSLVSWCLRARDVFKGVVFVVSFEAKKIDVPDNSFFDQKDIRKTDTLNIYIPYTLKRLKN